MEKLSLQSITAIRRIIGQAKLEGRKVMTELESKDMLAEADIPITKHVLAKSVEEAQAAAASMEYPLVMKIVSPTILHKTDAGCVSLNVDSVDAVTEQFKQIILRGQKIAAPEEIWGVAVQEMVPGGQEIIVCVKRDQIFGPTILLGMGGILVELLKDVSLRLVPLSREDVWEMLSEVKGSKLLSGYRGSFPLDQEKVVEIVLKVSALAQEFPEIEEMDLNPIVIYEAGMGAKVVDARIILNIEKKEVD